MGVAYKQARTKRVADFRRNQIISTAWSDRVCLKFFRMSLKNMAVLLVNFEQYTSKVMDMSYMFYNASAFDRDMSGWDTPPANWQDPCCVLSPFWAFYSFPRFRKLYVTTSAANDVFIYLIFDDFCSFRQSASQQMCILTFAQKFYVMPVELWTVFLESLEVKSTFYMCAVSIFVVRVLTVWTVFPL